MKTLQIAAALLCISLLPNTASAAAKAASTPEGFFKKYCGTCHSLEAGKNKGGPSLAGIFGKKAGTVEGFKKYKGLKGADFVWTPENMDAFITDPKKFVKANTPNKKSGMMSKVKKAEVRATIIEYMKAH